MGVPLSQVVRVASYVTLQRLRGRRQFPLVLMLEPLFRCNLACAGCGKIQHPSEVLRRQLTPEQCFDAVDQCGAPMVSLPGGEPLLHEQIEPIVAGIIARRKFVYLCTNALLLSKSLEKFHPTKYLTFSVHIDGLRETHDRAVCRSGVYDTAITAIKAAVDAGFRVTTNTTLFAGADPGEIRQLFDRLMDLGVEGMTISPGYAYTTAPDQDHFLRRQRTVQLFRQILERPRRRWRFSQSPLFLEFLKGKVTLECTPWGNPTYGLFGWQRPCYLVNEGYAETFQQLIEETDWDQYGHASGNPKCRDCMVHCGHEPTAVVTTLGSIKGLLATARLMLIRQKPGAGSDGPPSRNPPPPPAEKWHAGPPHLVQLRGEPRRSHGNPPMAERDHR
jgi:hopanoid biosynthesis associated radical SAM protein HpnH